MMFLRKRKWHGCSKHWLVSKERLAECGLFFVERALRSKDR